jgi:hypothetical protein
MAKNSANAGTKITIAAPGRSFVIGVSAWVRVCAWEVVMSVFRRRSFLQPGPPDPNQDMGHHGNDRETNETLCPELMEFLGLFVAQARNRASTISHVNHSFSLFQPRGGLVAQAGL